MSGFKPEFIQNQTKEEVGFEPTDDLIKVTNGFQDRRNNPDSATLPASFNNFNQSYYQPFKRVFSMTGKLIKIICS